MEKWYWLNDYSIKFLERGYLLPGQTAQERIMQIGQAAEEILKEPGFADRFYDYMSRGWISLSTPVWSNFGLKRGLPISCFGSFVPDNMQGILGTVAEIGMMTKYGGGCSAYFGDLRPRGSEIKNNGNSSGSVHFMQMFESLVDTVSQGSTRRGHVSPYLPIEHSDAKEFLEIGTEGNLIQKLTHGITVTDKWMEEMIGGDAEKRDLWAKVLQRRSQMGYPYILFVDTANKNKPDCYKDKQILASNMCSEIMLPSNKDWSFVCCLSSLNLRHYDEWKTTDLVETMTKFLDAVMEEFITKLEQLRDSNNEEDRGAFLFMSRAHKFAKDNRALGLGVLGYHSYLQSKMIAFDSSEAKLINAEMFAHIRHEAEETSKQLAEKFGEPEVLTGYGKRNATLLAIAPTTSSAFILGQVSQGIEPVWSNCYIKDVAKLKVTIKNPFLVELLSAKGKDTKEVWDSIRDNDGSVQHLDFLTDNEKAVFRTFAEIDQAAVIDQAANRQVFIDQGQSLNIMIHPDVPIKDVNALHIRAWKSGVKSLYYQHSVNAAQQLSIKKSKELLTK